MVPRLEGVEASPAGGIRLVDERLLAMLTPEEAHAFALVVPSDDAVFGHATLPAVKLGPIEAAGGRQSRRTRR
jgi:hypothetical protein